jgi:hypothetical protein
LTYHSQGFHLKYFPLHCGKNRLVQSKNSGYELIDYSIAAEKEKETSLMWSLSAHYWYRQ